VRLIKPLLNSKTDLFGIGLFSTVPWGNALGQKGGEIATGNVNKTPPPKRHLVYILC